MKKTITLSETAVKLLAEFIDADAKFELAKRNLYFKATTRDEEDAQQVRAFNRSIESRKTAACVFAACVTEMVSKEVANG